MIRYRIEKNTQRMLRIQRDGARNEGFPTPSE
jgi:hypothetical protein